MQRICVTLSDEEHRAVVLAALRARRKTNGHPAWPRSTPAAGCPGPLAGGLYARDMLIASVPSAMGVTAGQVQADARRKRKRAGQVAA